MDAAGLAVVLGLTAIAYFGQISPTLSRHEQAQAQVTQLASEQANSKELERSLLTMKDRLDVVQRADNGASLRLEPLSALNQRLAKLTDLAAASGLQVDAIESGATSNLERYSTVAIRISGRGTYRNCAAMLRQLRSATPDVGVVSFQMASAAVSADTTATFLFELLWHTQPQPRPAKK
jgi:Tfp pilus assembly protein PilO